MGGTNRRLGRSITWLVVLLAKAVLVSAVAAGVAGAAFYSLQRVFPFASLNPIKVYDAVLKIKRDWPAFEKQIPESDRENHREVLSFMKATDTGVLVVVALGFDLVLIVIGLQLYLTTLVLTLFMWYLLEHSLGAVKERAA